MTEKLDSNGSSIQLGRLSRISENGLMNPAFQDDDTGQNQYQNKNQEIDRENSYGSMTTINLENAEEENRIGMTREDDRNDDNDNDKYAKLTGQLQQSRSHSNSSSPHQLTTSIGIPIPNSINHERNNNKNNKSTKNGTAHSHSNGNGNGLSPPPQCDDQNQSQSQSQDQGQVREQFARENWESGIEFLLSCISMSVGLGNVWRFPATAYENGGGCFLIVYFIVLIFVGRPIYFLELVLGQFSSYGPIKIWKMVPALKGIGYGQMMGATCVVSYYVSIMGLTVLYFIFSFGSKLPWSECNTSWAGSCDANKNMSLTYPNRTLSQLFFQNEILQEKASIVDGIGAPEWRLTLCLLFSWVTIFAVLFKGVKSSGKWAYFTSLFPYVVIIVLLIRGVTLEGAWNGIYYFLVPQWHKLYDVKIWYAAVSQCFISLGSGFGIITMLSSYNKFNRNIYKDAMIISLADTCTSLLAGITVFAILGHLGHISGVDISKVVQKGPGLAFESLPYAIAQFSWLPQIFSILFFLMLFIIGLGSACALTNTLVTVIADEFQGLKRWLLVGSICTVGFLFGLIYTTPGGQYMVTLVDYFGVSFLLYVMATLEIIAVSWFYGINNIIQDVEFMLKCKLSMYWIFCWKYFAPLSLAAILFYSLFTAESVKYNGKEFPIEALISGRILSAFSLMWIPVCAIHTIYKRKEDTLMKKILASFRPGDSWGPQDPSIRAEWEVMKNEKNGK